MSYNLHTTTCKEGCLQCGVLSKCPWVLIHKSPIFIILGLLGTHHVQNRWIHFCNYGCDVHHTYVHLLYIIIIIEHNFAGIA